MAYNKPIYCMLYGHEVMESVMKNLNPRDMWNLLRVDRRSRHGLMIHDYYRQPASVDPDVNRDVHPITTFRAYRVVHPLKEICDGPVTHNENPLHAAAGALIPPVANAPFQSLFFETGSFYCQNPANLLPFMVGGSPHGARTSCWQCAIYVLHLGREAVRDSAWIPLCQQCLAAGQVLYPNGLNTCTCPEKYYRNTCEVCSSDETDRIEDKADRRITSHPFTHYQRGRRVPGPGGNYIPNPSPKHPNPLKPVKGQETAEKPRCPCGNLLIPSGIHYREIRLPLPNKHIYEPRINRDLSVGHEWAQMCRICEGVRIPRSAPWPDQQGRPLNQEITLYVPEYLPTHSPDGQTIWDILY